MTDLRDTYSRILAYLEQQLDDDPVHEWILHETVARGIPEIQITLAQGRFLQLLASTVGARRILEIGTLSGYSGVWLARALPPDGLLITLEVNERHAQLARESFARAGVSERVRLEVGPALETLERLELDAPLDLAFIDADKPNNLNYFQWAWDRTRSGGLILVDNVLANGRVVDPENDNYAGSIRAFNDYIMAHHKAQSTILPFFKEDEDNLDGLLLVRVP